MLENILLFTSENAPTTLDEARILKNILDKPEFCTVSLNHYDIENETAQELIRKYRIKAIPSTVFLGKDGRFIRKITGKPSENDYNIYIKFDLTNNIDF